MSNKKVIEISSSANLGSYAYHHSDYSLQYLLLSFNILALQIVLVETIGTMISQSVIFYKAIFCCRQNMASQYCGDIYKMFQAINEMISSVLIVQLGDESSRFKNVALRLEKPLILQCTIKQKLTYFNLSVLYELNNLKKSHLEAQIILSQFNYKQTSIMSKLTKYYSELRDKISIGSISISSEDYPFSAFCLGYLFAKTSTQIQTLFQLMEALDELIKCKKISAIQIKKVLEIVEVSPSEVQKLAETLSKIRRGSKIDINSWLESFNQEDLQSSSRIQQTQSLEPKQPSIKYEGTIEIQDFIQQQRQNQQQIDIELARKMQEAFNMQEKPKVQQDDTPCEICYTNLFQDEVETLQCGHLFHKNCLVQSFKSNIISNSFPIKCPNDDCKRPVEQNDLKVILSREMYEKYQEHTLKAYADEHGDSISWCPTANCGYMFFFQKDDSSRFQCLECHKEYCLNCRVQWHKDMTCKEYKVSTQMSQDDKKFMDFVKGKKFKQCPKCKFWVEKNQGCDHMTCKCKFEFCYKCGGIYMKCQCVEIARKKMEEHLKMNEERKLARKAETLRRRQEQKKKRDELKRIEKERKEAQKQERRSKRKR